MNRIEQKFKTLKASGKAAFMPYLTAGDPDLQTTHDLISAFSDAGADVIELGLPFSDPVADGPTIQAASQRSLNSGVKVKAIFEMVKKVREKTQVPICFMTYYNLVYHYGLEAFAAKMAEVGGDGLIVPDLSIEESPPLLKAAEKFDLRLISFVAPTSSPERVKMIASAARGFIYLVSLTGVTGAREELSANLGEMVSGIRACTRVPVCVGFGVGTPEQAAAVARVADGVIVGSAIVKEINKHQGQADQIDQTAAFVKDMVRAVKSV